MSSKKRGVSPLASFGGRERLGDHAVNVVGRAPVGHDARTKGESSSDRGVRDVDAAPSNDPSEEASIQLVDLALVLRSGAAMAEADRAQRDRRQPLEGGLGIDR